DVYEFVLDRSKLFAGKHGLRPVGPDEPAQSFFRHEGFNPFDQKNGRTVIPRAKTQLKSCIQCHQSPGIYSVTSMQRGLKNYDDGNFKTYDWRVDLSYIVGSKVERYDWGLLQGMLEATRNVPRNADDATQQ
ncbi:MAG: hypothetical protein IH991_21990, partial [Planctomycetes bacterium]|nr:hypothetical protein [Planctomycetota bacterium]